MAYNKPTYTAPIAVSMMQQRNALLPALYASDGEMILLPDGVENVSGLKYSHIVDSKQIRIIRFDELPGLDYTEISVAPWGWNLALWHKLAKHGVPKQALSSLQYIEKLRELCHRRMTIAANSHKAFDVIREYMPSLPIEFVDADEAMQWADRQDDLFFKAPWSSSGHGVFHLSRIHTPDEYFAGRQKLAAEWLNGTIARQGSVMAEVGIDKLLDCATEWLIGEDKTISFIGYSVFHADENGHYLGNIKLPQSHLRSLIQDALNQSVGQDILDDILAAQKCVLSEHIAPYYHGPLGIDMIVGQHGVVAPVVEINLRMTQGMVVALSSET